MTILAEIENETWHILTAIYTHQRLKEGLTKSRTRFELANQFVALNALLDILVIRIARLADKRKEVRSVSMLLKRGSYQAQSNKVETAANRFLMLAVPVVKIRHEQIAHMKPGTLSTNEPKDIPAEVLRATESLIDLIDIARGQTLSYLYKVGSMEPVVDLKASLIAGKMVTV